MMLNNDIMYSTFDILSTDVRTKKVAEHLFLFFRRRNIFTYCKEVAIKAGCISSELKSSMGAMYSVRNC
jgi:hypothetical protein